MMGFPQKSHVDAAMLDSDIEAQECIMAGMPLKRSLTRVKTRSTETATTIDEGAKESCTTPTSPESRIPVKVRCPDAPTKPRAKARCAKLGASMEFITTQDLESAFTIGKRVSDTIGMKP